MKYFKKIELYKEKGLAKRAKTANRRAKTYKVKGYFTKRTVENLYLKQLGRCACCDKLLQNGFEIDHILPLSKGGSNYPHNLQLLTKECNRKKGDKAMEVYLNG